MLSGTIGRYDGQRWQITPARARKDLLAITGDNDQVITVGAGGAAVRFDGRSWQAEATGSTAGLCCVATGASGSFFAAGDKGTILQRNFD